MNVVLDNNALVYLLNPRARRDTRARLKGLLSDVERTKGQVLIPTPVLTEYLSHVAERVNRQEIMERLRRSRWVDVAAFDEMAAVECSLLDSQAIASGNKRAPLDESAPWQAVKVDRQIVAIAKSRGASIVSGDSNLRRVAEWAGVAATRVEDLPVPESERQLLLEGVPLPEAATALLAASAKASTRSKSAAPLTLAQPPNVEPE